MSLTSLLQQRVTITTQDRPTPFTLEVDVSIEEMHSSRNEITRHPVEDGPNVVDHVRLEPYALQMTGMISNHPIDKWTIGVGNTDPNRATDAYNELIAMQYLGERLNIVTTLSEYRDMVLVSLDVPRNAKLGNVVRFTAQFEQIRTVTSETLDAGKPDTELARAKPQASMGKKPPQPATPAQESTFLFNLAGG